MRIIHTSDWHIGRTLGGYPLLEDQKYYLSQLTDVIMQEKIDALLVSGDIYQYAVPSAEAVELMNDFFTVWTQKCGVKVFLIAGNHDQPERLEFGSKMLSAGGLYIQGSLREGIRTVRLTDETSCVDVSMLPYFTPAKARALFQDDTIRTFQDAAAHFYRAYCKGKKRNADASILMAHGFYWNVKGDNPAVFSESECRIGEADLIDLSLFNSFDYIALGHLHAPQKVNEKAYYSGSPLKYSVEEAAGEKSVRLLEVDKEGKIHSENLHIPPLRDVRVVQGYFEELIGQKSEDYVFLHLKDPTYILGALHRLKIQYPHILGIRYTALSGKKQDTSVLKKEFLSPERLFQMFYEKTTGEKMDEREISFLQEIVKEASADGVD